MKTLTLIYCNDGEAGKLLAKTIRTNNSVVGLRNASVFVGEPERCDAVVVTDDVQKFYRDRICAAYPAKTIVPLTVEAIVQCERGELIEQTLIEPKRFSLQAA